MAKDYASGPRKTNKPSKKNDGRYRESRKQAKAQPFSLFTLLKSGVFVCLLGMSGLYLYDEFGKNFNHWLYPGHSKEDLRALREQQQAKFEFYSLLKQETSKAMGSKKPKEAHQSATAVATVEKKASLQPDRNQYLLQVASFRQQSDADRLKAELTLKGFDVRISPFVNEDRTWYRVKIGPFNTLSSVKEARSTLSPLGLNGMIQRVG